MTNDSLIEKLEALRAGTVDEGFYTKMGMQGMLDACIAVVRQHHAEVRIENDRILVAGRWYYPKGDL